MKNLLDRVRAEFGSGNIAAPAIHKMSLDVYREIKNWPIADRDRFCTELFASGMHAQGALVCYVYRRFGKQCGSREFRLFTRWLDRYVHNWGLTDGLSLWLLGASIKNDPSLIERLYAWTRSRNRWKRRAAAVTMVPSARKGLHTGEIFKIAESLLSDQDNMVQKGVGWLLKETYPRHRNETVAFLVPRRSATSRMVLRYAAGKMTAADRARILSR